MNSAEIVSALRRHYGEGYCLVEQVADHAGLRASRWLDLMAFGLWPSRGLEIHGIEVKVRRSDLAREMASPEKADATAIRCDRFYVAAPAGVVDTLWLATLAPAWGLLEVEEDRAGKRTVRTAKAAERNAHPKPVDRDFVAAVMRRVPSATDEARAEIRAELQREHELAVEAAVARRLDREVAGHTALRERVAAFEAAAGVKLGDWRTDGSAVALGRALRLLAGELGGWESARSRFRSIADNSRGRGRELAAAADRIGDLVAALDDVLGSEKVTGG